MQTGTRNTFERAKRQGKERRGRRVSVTVKHILIDVFSDSFGETCTRSARQVVKERKRGGGEKNPTKPRLGRITADQKDLVIFPESPGAASSQPGPSRSGNFPLAVRQMAARFDQRRTAPSELSTIDSSGPEENQ